MTCIRAWMSLKFGQIRQQTTELAVLKRFELAYNEDIHNILDELIFNFSQIGSGLWS